MGARHEVRFRCDAFESFAKELCAELDRLPRTPGAALVADLVDEVLEASRPTRKVDDDATGDARVLTLAVDPGDRELRFLAALRAFNQGADFVFDGHVIEGTGASATRPANLPARGED